MVGGARPVASRRLEDRIRELCSKAAAASYPLEFRQAVRNLKAAIHEHSERLRGMADSKPLRSDRRKSFVGIPGSNGND